MKKIFVLVLILLFGGFCYFYFFGDTEVEIPKVAVEEEVVSVDKYYTYSTYLKHKR